MIKANWGVIYCIAECVRTCNDCINASLKEDDPEMMEKCIELCQRCSAICVDTINLTYKNGRLKSKQLELCATACRECAEECDKHDTVYTRKCAEVCFNCEAMCMKYIGHLTQPSV